MSSPDSRRPAPARSDPALSEPGPWQLHPQLAERLGIAEGDWATVESRRGDCTLRARVVKTIRPDTVFIPYHWAGRKSANQLTIACPRALAIIA